MARPTATYVGTARDLPIRLIVPRGLCDSVARLISIREALELVADLTTALVRVDQEEKENIRPSPRKDNAATENYPRAVDHGAGSG